MCAEIRPHVHWVPVTDTRGRRQLEMRWSLTGAHTWETAVATASRVA
jgi:hypothetical protein